MASKTLITIVLALGLPHLGSTHIHGRLNSERTEHVQPQPTIGNKSEATDVYLVGYRGPKSQSGSCFPPESTVLTPTGRKRMDQLQIGDLVLDSSSEWTEVAAFLHAHQSGRTVYIRVLIDHSRSLLISPNHIIFRQKPDGSNQQEDVNASELQIGDVLFLTNGTGRVTQLQSVVRRGAYAPLTLSGSMLVDGVWVSCFASSGPFGPKAWGQYLTQTYFVAPLRLLYQAAKVFGLEKVLQDALFQPSADGAMLWYARFGLWMIS